MINNNDSIIIELTIENPMDSDGKSQLKNFFFLNLTFDQIIAVLTIRDFFVQALRMRHKNTRFLNTIFVKFQTVSVFENNSN